MYDDNADDADGTTADGLTALLEKNADAKNDEPLLVLPIATRRILADEMKRSICCAETIKLLHTRGESEERERGSVG